MSTPAIDYTRSLSDSLRKPKVLPSATAIVNHRIYNPAPAMPGDKHGRGGWGTEMNLDATTAQDLLRKGIQGPNGKQVYGMPRFSTLQPLTAKLG
jgi:hypothetical protein